MTAARLSSAIRYALVLTVTLAAAPRAASADPLQVELVLLSPPNLAVGIPIFWRAHANASGALLYRFRVGPSGAPLMVTRDFNTRNFLDFTPIDEGPSDVEVTVRAGSGETANARGSYLVTARVTSEDPVVSPTLHPLVALYSAPACAAGGAIRVRYGVQGAATEQFTPFKPCQPGRSVNFHSAGLYADTVYQLRHEVVSGGSSVFGPALTYRTGVPNTVFPPVVIMDPADDSTSAAEPVLLHGTLMSSTYRTFPMATDLNGQVLWYYDKSMYPWQTGAHLLRPLTGGTMLFVMNDNRVPVLPGARRSRGSKV